MSGQPTQPRRGGKEARREAGKEDSSKSAAPFLPPRPATTFDEMGIPFHQDVPQRKTSVLASTMRGIANLKVNVKKSKTKSSETENNKKKAQPATSGGTNSGPDPKFLVSKRPAPGASKIPALSLPSPVSPLGHRSGAAIPNHFRNDWPFVDAN